MTQHQKRALTGIQPSGNIHIGNFLGMIQPALRLQEHYQCCYFIADLHALTSTRDAKTIHEACYDIVAAWLALGLDTGKHLLYRQSDVACVTEFTWYLSCVTGFGLLEKAHAFKDAREKGKEVNHGLVSYPVLMAADILMYEPDVVPVGKDQKQHVEMARDIAGSLNAAYSADLLKLPAPLIDERVMVIPGLDGRKMSKSYGNVIPLFSDEATLKKAVMSIVTDSTPVEAPKSVKGTVLGDLYSLFATPAQAADLEARMSKGGLGWGHGKLELFELINAALRDKRENYFALRRDTNKLDAELDAGARRAFEIALPVLNRVRKASGMRASMLTIR